MADAPRVVVTGVGVTTAAGNSLDELWTRSLKGASGIGPLSSFDAGEARRAAAAEVPPFDVASDLQVPKSAKFMGRAVACAARAAHRAVEGSGLSIGAVDPYRVALYTGSGQTGLEADEFFDALETTGGESADADYRRMGGRASRRIDRYWSLRTLANGGLGLLAMEFGARGGSNNFVQGDTASALALAAGFHELVENRADVAIVGGFDSLVTVSTYLAYERAGLLSRLPPEAALRPFDRARDGLVLGEAAAFFVLERADDARRRSAPVIGELLGVGAAQQTLDTTRPKASAAAAQAACGQAIGSSTPHVVIAHGIATRDDDRDEAAILRTLVPAGTPITAFKGLTGYVGAATAAVETALALATVFHQVTPPVARHDGCDEDCALPIVTGSPRPLGGDSATALALSWSWSGQCAAVAVRAAVN
jgi:3-oxoacyl-[acyl-carrier-protein] synthase II